MPGTGGFDSTEYNQEKQLNWSKSEQIANYKGAYYTAYNRYSLRLNSLKQKTKNHSHIHRLKKYNFIKMKAIKPKGHKGEEWIVSSTQC